MEQIELLSELQTSRPLAQFWQGVSKFVAYHLEPVAGLSEEAFDSYGGKSISDPIVGYSHLLPWEVAIVDTRLFQRLRGITQLGLAKLVYPALAYSRFEHTLGVLARSMEMVNRLKYIDSVAKYPKMPVGATIDDFLTPVRLAALFHDIGHCLFSHVSERILWNLQGSDRYPSSQQILKEFQTFFRRPKMLAPAEVLSIAILTCEPMRSFLRKLDIKEGGRDNIIARWVCDAAHFIAGMPVPGRPNTVFLAQVISGGLDADKLDYMPREAHYANLPLSVDLGRIIDKINVFECKGESLPEGLRHLKECFDDQGLLVFGMSKGGQFAFEEFCLARVSLYDKIYLHQKVRAAEAQLGSYLARIPSKVREYDQLHSWLWLSESGVAQPDSLLPREVKVESYKEMEIKYSDFGVTKLRDRALVRRAFAFGPSNSLSDPLPSTDQHTAPTRSMSLFQVMKNGADGYTLLILAELRKIVAALDASTPIHEDDLRDILLDVPEYERVQQGQNSLYIEHPASLPIRWTLPIDQVVHYYLQNRALGYLFAPSQLCALVLLAAERVIWDEFALQYAQEGYVASSVISNAERIRQQLDKNNYYVGARRLKPLSPFLKLMATNEKIASITAKLRAFCPPGKLPVTVADVTAFVGQFPQELQPSALMLCDRFEIVYPIQVGKLVSEVFHDASDQLSGKVAIVPLGNLADSANHLIYSWKNNADEKIRTVGNKVTMLADSVVRTSETIILFDDNINSGYQALNILAEWLEVDLPENVKLAEHHVDPLGKVAQKRLKQINLIFVFGVGREQSEQEFRAALHLVGVDSDRVKVTMGRCLRSEERILSGSGSILEEAKRLQLKSYLSKVGAQILLPDVYEAAAPGEKELMRNAAKRRALGDHETEGTILFPYNTPSMTIAAFWCTGMFEGQKWIPLFERRRNIRLDGAVVGESS
ncbi:hypothetical protein DES53_106234 [Roseimicrobium gellanilyticum]|uniref:HD/PDEase domain-containing protein n=1 Tax=Roseimicrobium gellanilyticum TaxID=748857 RepID=A0A366HJI2_9BACT|nr:HD domain-containing protein [Roseimicrobium gellanilyticum]RBP42525.1 hypothetical protein DES53_106234 [Roseimicrobium gellanilyticum]